MASSDPDRSTVGWAPLAEPTYATSVLGNGIICPIHEKLGRRLLRHIPPGSIEGRRLLRGGRVTVLVKDGRRFSGLPIAEVFALLARDISRAAAEADPRAREDLDRLLEAYDRQRRAFS